jgi:hypothetical protein
MSGAIPLHPQYALIAWCSVKKARTSLPCLTKHHAMKTYWGNGGIVPHILDLGSRVGEWLASRPGRFTPRERALGTNWIGGWVGPRAALDTVVKRKISSHRRESNSRTPIVQPVGQALFRLSHYIELSLTRLDEYSCLAKRKYLSTWELDSIAVKRKRKRRVGRQVAEDGVTL